MCGDGWPAYGSRYNADVMSGMRLGIDELSAAGKRSAFVGERWLAIIDRWSVSRLVDLNS